MKLTYRGTSPVDIAGHFDVQPGDTVDVPAEQAAALLLAGTSIDADGKKTPPASPLWVAEKSKTAEAGKDAQ